jgi:hypothetical protein
MKHIVIAVAALGLIANSNAQLWDGSPLPPAVPMAPSVDSYFADGGGLSEFDMDIGIELSLQENGTKPADIDAAHGWTNAADFAFGVEDGDQLIVTYLGKTAGWLNDFGLNAGGSNAYGPGAYTLWSSIDNGTPAVGEQFSFSVTGSFAMDFWLNSNEAVHGGTYSMFFPGTSVPSNTGLPDFDYSALGKIFNVNDSISGNDRSILVIAIEDWRSFDADFTDMFFAIEIYDRDGDSQFPVPEPSTYGLIGAMALLGLAAIRRSRR